MIGAKLNQTNPVLWVGQFFEWVQIQIDVVWVSGIEY